MTTILREARRAVAVLTAAALLGPSPALAAEAQRATLEGVEAGTDKVSIHLSKPSQFNAFTTAEPPRLVVELLNTEHEGPSQVVKGKGKFLEKVRAGQYQKDPAPIARVVLYLKSLVSYKARWEGPRLDVELVGPQSDADVAAAAAPPAPAPVKKDPPPPPAVAVSTPVAKPQPKPAPVPAAAPVVAAKPPAPAPVPAPKPAAALPVETVAAAKDDVAMPKGMTTDPSAELSRMAGVSVPKAAVHASSGKLRRDILASLPSDPVTLEFDNMDVHDVLALLAQKANVNMVYGADVTGSITLQLRDVPFNEAFLTVLSMKGLVANQVGENILRVLTPASLKTERSVAVNQTRVIKLKYAKAEEISTSITAVASAEGRTAKLVVDKNTNSLIITDTLEGIAAVERLLSELDIRPQQVLIEAKLVEVQLSKDLALGIQWDYLSSDEAPMFNQAGRTIIGSVTTPKSASSPTLPPLVNNVNTTAGDGANGRGTGVFLPADKVFGAFTFGRVTNNYFLSATLTAAASQGKAKVLSDPKVTTLNGKKATINITTKIPFVTTETTPSAGTITTQQKVEYQETGITLDVLPTINADGRITLEVKPSVKQPSATAASAGTTGAISVDSREANTIVIVQDGGTVVIGGLITDSSQETVAKVPLLGDIPILGYLFRKKFVDRKRVELLIFVTTKIMAS